MPGVGSTLWIKELKEVELPAVFAARGLVMGEMRPELTSLKEQFGLVQSFAVSLAAKAKAEATLAAVAGGEGEGEGESEGEGEGGVVSDPLAGLLEAFVGEKKAVLDGLVADVVAMEAEVKQLASFLAEPPSSGAEALFAPIAAFVTAFEQVHSDNLLEAAKEKRKQESARRRSLPGSSSSSSLLINKAGDGGPPGLRRSSTTAGMELGRRRAQTLPDSGVPDPSAEVFDDLRRELQRRASTRRKIEHESPPDSPWVAATPGGEGTPAYGANYDESSRPAGGGKGGMGGPPPSPHVFEIPKLRSVKLRTPSKQPAGDGDTGGDGPPGTATANGDRPPPLDPPADPPTAATQAETAGGRLAGRPFVSPVPGSHFDDVDVSPSEAESAAGPPSSGPGSGAAATARQLRWLAMAESAAMDRESLQDDRAASPPLAESTRALAPGAAAATAVGGRDSSHRNSSSSSGSGHAKNGAGGTTAKGAGSEAGSTRGSVSGFIRQARQHSLSRKRDKEKAAAAAAVAATAAAAAPSATGGKPETPSPSSTNARSTPDVPADFGADSPGSLKSPLDGSVDLVELGEALNENIGRAGEAFKSLERGLSSLFGFGGGQASSKRTSFPSMEADLVSTPASADSSGAIQGTQSSASGGKKDRQRQPLQF